MNNTTKHEVKKDSPIGTKSKSPYFYRSLALLLGIGILAVLIYIAGPENFLRELRKTSPLGLILAVLIYSLSWVFRTWRLSFFTNHAGKKIRAFDLFKLHVSGYALNTLLPFKLGDAATVGFLKMQGIYLGKAMAIVLQTRILDLLSLIIVSIPALLFFLKKGEADWAVTSLIIAVFFICIPFLVVALDKNKALKQILKGIAKKLDKKPVELISDKLSDAYDAYHGIASDLRLLFSAVLLSIVIWLLEGVTCYMVARAAGATISIFPVILAVSISNLGKSVPITPGAIGVYESIMAALLHIFGVPFDIAILIAILDHALKKGFTLAFGLPATLGIGFNLAQIYEFAKQKQDQ